MTNQDRTWWESGLWPIMRDRRHKHTHAHTNKHMYTHAHTKCAQCTQRLIYTTCMHTLKPPSVILTKRPTLIIALCWWNLRYWLAANGPSCDQRLRENILSAPNNMDVLTCRPEHVSALLHVSGCFGKGGVHIQAFSDHIKITINNESMSHVCSCQILTQQDSTVMSACVSHFDSIHLAGTAWCSWAAPTGYFLKCTVYTHRRVHTCVSRWVRGWFTVGMWTIVIVP